MLVTTPSSWKAMEDNLMTLLFDMGYTIEAGAVSPWLVGCSHGWSGWVGVMGQGPSSSNHNRDIMTMWVGSVE